MKIHDAIAVKGTIRTTIVELNGVEIVVETYHHGTNIITYVAELHEEGTIKLYYNYNFADALNAHIDGIYVAVDYLFEREVW